MAFSGPQLHNHRTAAGLSQEELAHRISVSRYTLQRWEKGRGVPTFNKAEAIARELGCGLDDLSGPNGECLTTHGRA